MRVFVHIGTEKTGTTALQRFLWGNRAALHEQSVLFIGKEIERADHNLVLAAYDLNHRDAKTAQKNIANAADMAQYQSTQWKEFERTVLHAGCNTVVLSSELFQSRLTREDEVQRFRDKLSDVGFDDVRIVVYLREPAATCNSLFSTAVRTGSTLPHPPEPEGRSYFSTVCDHRRTMELWSSVFGMKNIEPRIYSRGSPEGWNIIQDFCKVIQAEYEALDSLVPLGFENPSLSWLAVELLVRLNRTIPATIDGGNNPKRRGLVRRLESLPGQGYIMPGWLWDRYTNYFKNGNEWVRSIWFPDQSTLFPVEARPESEGGCVATKKFVIDECASFVSDVWLSVAPKDA